MVLGHASVEARPMSRVRAAEGSGTGAARYPVVRTADRNRPVWREGPAVAAWIRARELESERACRPRPGGPARAAQGLV